MWFFGSMTQRQKRAVAVGGAAVIAILVGWLLWASSGPGAPASVGPDGSSSTAEAGKREPMREPARPVGRPGVVAGDGGPVAEVLEPSSGEVLTRFGWGSGDEALGRERQAEGNAEGPMSLTVGADGSVYVLDQINQRLVRLDAKGKRLSSTPLPLQAAQDVVVTKDGTALVMDRLVDKAVAIIGPDGKQKGELPIEGKGLSEGGASTGLFQDGDDVLVEREHGDLVRIGKTDGKRDEARGEVPGRPSRDGANYLTAVIIEASQGLASLTAIAKATLEHRFTRQVSFGQPILSLVMLDTDPSGIAYLGAQGELPGSTPEALRVGIMVLCLDGRDGATLGRATFPANTVPDESFRELTVGGDGSILFLRRTDQGAQLERHRCQ